MKQTFKTIIEAWPSTEELAADLKESPWKVRKWKQRNSIPSDYWLDLLAAAKKRKIPLSETALIRMASREMA